MQQQHFQPCPGPAPVDGGGRGSVTKEKWKRAVYLPSLHRQWLSQSLLSPQQLKLLREFLDHWHNAPVKTCVSEDVSYTALLEGLNSTGETNLFHERLLQNPGPDGFSSAISPGCLCPLQGEGKSPKWKLMKSADEFPSALK